MPEGTLRVLTGPAGRKDGKLLAQSSASVHRCLSLCLSTCTWQLQPMLWSNHLLSNSAPTYSSWELNNLTGIVTPTFLRKWTLHAWKKKKSDRWYHLNCCPAREGILEKLGTVCAAFHSPWRANTWENENYVKQGKPHSVTSEQWNIEIFATGRL